VNLSPIVITNYLKAPKNSVQKNVKKIFLKKEKKFIKKKSVVNVLKQKNILNLDSEVEVGKVQMHYIDNQFVETVKTKDKKTNC
jgi:hypothetical protein